MGVICHNSCTFQNACREDVIVFGTSLHDENSGPTAELMLSDRPWTTIALVEPIRRVSATSNPDPPHQGWPYQVVDVTCVMQTLTLDGGAKFGPDSEWVTWDPDEGPDYSVNPERSQKFYAGRKMLLCRVSVSERRSVALSTMLTWT